MAKQNIYRCMIAAVFTLTLTSMVYAVEKIELVNADSFQTVYQQNMFSRHRAPDMGIISSAPQAVCVERVSSIYTLKGTADDGMNKTAFIEDEITGETFTLSVNDELAALSSKVVGIGSDYVIVKQDGTARKIAIGKQLGTLRVLQCR